MIIYVYLHPKHESDQFMLKNYTLFLLTLVCNFVFSQPANDDCTDAIRLCPGITLSGTTAGATPEGTDYNFCYTPENTVWYVFTTNSLGGNAVVSFTDLVFNPDPTLGQELQALFFRTAGDCGVTPYAPMSTCGLSAVDFDINELIVLDANTTYYIQISGTSVGFTGPSECDFDISISGTAVEVLDPTVTVTIAEPNICQGTSSEIIVTIENCEDVTNYEWFYNGGSIFSALENDFTTAGLTENGVLSLTISCGSFCTKTATSIPINITVIPVSAEAGADQFINEGAQANLNGSGIGDPTWTPGSSLSNTTSLNTIASPTSSTTYFLTMENEGCFATDSVTIFVGEILIIYTSFSPNGDNINDRWHIVNSEKFPNMEVNIYDRSGQRVFNAINYSQEEKWWDGLFKGKPLPTSTYYYVINLNDPANTEYKGYVNIIR